MVGNDFLEKPGCIYEAERSVAENQRIHQYVGVSNLGIDRNISDSLSRQRQGFTE